MYPILFEVFGFPVPAYGVLFVTGMLLGVIVARWQAPTFGVTPGDATDLIFSAIIGGFICAKLLYILILVKHFGFGGFDLWTALRGGGVWYGGLIGGLVGFAAYGRRLGLSFWTVSDLALPGAILGHAVGRIGCFLAGCCYGAPTDLPFAVTYTNEFCATSFGTPLGIPIHPVQLYESGAEFLIGGGLIVLSRFRAFSGQVVLTYLILYAPLRFGLEFVRTDFRGDWLGGALSTSQLLALAGLALGVAGYVYRWRRRDRPLRAGSRRASPEKSTAGERS